MSITTATINAAHHRLSLPQVVVALERSWRPVAFERKMLDVRAKKSQLRVQGTSSKGKEMSLRQKARKARRQGHVCLNSC